MASVEEWDFDYVGPVTEKCEYAVDIAFLIDSSKSVEYEYKKLLHFVREIARTFGISDTGTHAGAILFSDLKNYTQLYIKLNDYDTTESFNRAIFKSPFLGYRTRIDLAFKMTEEKLFTFRGGARPNMRQVIFLITDGRQNPRSYKSTMYDPVKASKRMYERGINIFAVGVGQIINRTELEAITRHKDRVFYEANFDAVLEESFIKNVSKKLCKGAIAGTTPPPLTRSVPTNKTTTTVSNTTKSNCSKDMHGRCCSMHDVYVNIFHGGTGPNYLIQGAKVTHNSGSLMSTIKSSEEVSPKIDVEKEITNEEIINLLKKNLPFDGHLIDIIDKKLRGKENLIVKRKRRSLDRNNGLSTLLNAAAKLGCSRFLNVLSKTGLLNEQNSKTILCPMDAYLDSNSPMLESKPFLKSHVGRKINSHVYETLYEGKRLLVEGKENDWKVNEIPIFVKLVNDRGYEIYLIKGTLYSQEDTIDLALLQRPELSLFKNAWSTSQLSLENIAKSIKSICFAKEICLGLSNELSSYLQDTLQAKKFSIIAPVNRRFIYKIDKIRLTKDYAKGILNTLIYVGKLVPTVANPNILSFDMTNDTRSAHFYMNNRGRMMIENANGEKFVVKETLHVKEGVLYIVE